MGEGGGGERNDDPSAWALIRAKIGNWRSPKTRQKQQQGFQGPRIEGAGG